jgi:methylated-DNA-[protein]-cysteine S-methyltransferase
MDQMGLRLRQEQFGDVLDRLILYSTPAGISRVTIRRGRKPATLPSPAAQTGTLLAQARQEIVEYLAGERAYFTVPADLSQVSEFDRRALDLVAAIPYGEVRTYKWIAERLGSPDAARAVGSAMAHNPVPILVPCHRVVRTDGGLGGYSFGLFRKEALLDLERNTAPLVGCASTRTACRRGCPRERELPAADRTALPSAVHAAENGYRPCPVCQPPLLP